MRKFIVKGIGEIQALNALDFFAKLSDKLGNPTENVNEYIFNLALGIQETEDLFLRTDNPEHFLEDLISHNIVRELIEKIYIVRELGEVKACSACEFFDILNSRLPSPLKDSREYIIALAKKLKENSEKPIRSDCPENALEDLLSNGFVFTL